MTTNEQLKKFDELKFLPDKGIHEIVCIWPFQPKQGSRQMHISNHHAHLLLHNQFLDDTLIDFGITHVITTNENENDRYRRSYHFHPLLVGELRGKEKFSPMDRQKSYARFTKGVRIFTKDFLLFPVNKQCHWFTIVVVRPSLIFRSLPNGPMMEDLQRNLPCVLIMDSLQASNVRAYVDDIKLIRDFLVVEWMTKACTAIQVASGEISFEVEASKWNKVFQTIVTTPQQPNGFDCGLYTVRNCLQVMNYLEKSTRLELNEQFAYFASTINYTQTTVTEDRFLSHAIISSMIPHYERLVLSSTYPKESTHEEATLGLSEEECEVVMEKNTAIICKMVECKVTSSNETKSLLPLSDYQLHILYNDKVINIFLSFLFDVTRTKSNFCLAEILKKESISFYPIV